MKNSKNKQKKSKAKVQNEEKELSKIDEKKIIS